MKLLFILIRSVYLSQHFFGKERLKTFLLKLYRILKLNSHDLISAAYDGRKFHIDLYDRTYDRLFFTGYFEKNESQFIERIVKPGCTVLDIGANFGWHTTLCSRLCGSNGEVHAFEPVPSTLEELRYNIRLNQSESNVVVNDFALGNEKETAQIFLFEGLPHSHASLSNLGRSDGRSFLIQVIPLDDYAHNNLRDKQVRFIKLDVEGAELKVLEGGKNFFRAQKDLWVLFEINLETSNAFGYNQQTLIGALESIGFSRFFKAGVGGKPEQISDFGTLVHGANVFCHKKE